MRGIYCYVCFLFSFSFFFLLFRGLFLTICLYHICIKWTTLPFINCVLMLYSIAHSPRGIRVSAVGQQNPIAAHDQSKCGCTESRRLECDPWMDSFLPLKQGPFLAQAVPTGASMTVPEVSSGTDTRIPADHADCVYCVQKLSSSRAKLSLTVSSRHP
jgi:hypothetical protein